MTEADVQPSAQNATMCAKQRRDLDIESSQGKFV